MSLIKSLKISWLSSQRIDKISFGEVTSHKIVNSRTFKPELGGLFDPRIFGPFLNYECYCGKYRGKQNKGQKCERCEVLISEKNIQRWRMGHISLVSPVTNIILFKNLATNLSKVLGISVKSLEDIIYLRSFVVIDNGLSNLLKKKQLFEKKIDQQLVSGILEEIITHQDSKKEVISQAKKLKENLEAEDNKDDMESTTVFLEDYLDFLEKYWKIKIWTGTEAFRELLISINIEEEIKKAKIINSGAKKNNSEKLRFLKGLQRTQTNLEWMIMTKLPVIPCGLRPITKLEGDSTIATTAINNSYRKIILVNQKLKDNEELNNKLQIFPMSIIYKLKEMLQKSVDKLILGATFTNKSNETKSLSQSLSGKEGILRHYSLGKRVDYSARSVITPNPDLLLHQVGLPVEMAFHLFKPFVIRKMLENKVVFTVEEAKQLILEEDPVVFTILNKITQSYPVLINRAPSLHRLSIQGFYVSLVLGKSIQLSTLKTGGFNADFDGDTMAIHVPLTKKTCEEVKNVSLSTHHTIDPKNGNVIDLPSQEIILGIFYLTKEKKLQKPIFYDEIGNIKKSFDKGEINLHDLIVIPACLVERNFSLSNNKLLVTTLGKIIFNQILPPSFPFYLNSLEDYNQKENNDNLLMEISEIDKDWKKLVSNEGWKKKDIINFINNLVRKVPKEEMVEFLDQLKKLGFEYATYSGISISPFELEGIVYKEKELEQAEKKIKQIDEHFSQGLYNEAEEKTKKIAVWEECKDNLQLQLIDNLQKRTNSSFYSIWYSGARASSENLTQIFAMRGLTTNYLGEVIKTPIISSLWEGLTPFEFFFSVYGAMKGMIDTALKTAEAGYLTRRIVEAAQTLVIVSEDCQTNFGINLEEKDLDLLIKRIYGRYLLKDVYNENKEILLVRDNFLLEKEIKIIQENKINSLWVRSPITCELASGLCQKCYGADLSKPGHLVSIGTAVGIIAAQSLGEPGTQLTMRTFHGGGIFGGEDIIQGLPKVKQILDNIKPEKEEKAILAKITGEIISIENKIIKQKSEKGEEVLYPLSEDKLFRFRLGNMVKKGEKITGGKVSLEEYLKIMGRDECQRYIKEEVRDVYSNQGIEINEKHIEIIARQMLSKVEVEDGGDSDHLVGDIVNYQDLQRINQTLIINKKSPIIFKNIISSLKDLASNPDSFLAGISFQNTLKSLVNYSLYNPIDHLKGIKESLIAGQLLPIGEGFNEREKYSKISTKRES